MSERERQRERDRQRETDRERERTRERERDRERPLRFVQIAVSLFDRAFVSAPLVCGLTGICTEKN